MDSIRNELDSLYQWAVFDDIKLLEIASLLARFDRPVRRLKATDSAPGL